MDREFGFLLQFKEIHEIVEGAFLVAFEGLEDLRVEGCPCKVSRCDGGFELNSLFPCEGG